MSWAGNDTYDRDGFRLNDPSGGGAAPAAQMMNAPMMGGPPMGAPMGVPMGAPMGAPAGPPPMQMAPAGPPPMQMQMQTIQIPQPQMQTVMAAPAPTMRVVQQIAAPPPQMQTISVPQMAPQQVMQTISVPQTQQVQYVTVGSAVPAPQQQTIRVIQQAPAPAPMMAPPPPQGTIQVAQFNPPPPPAVNGTVAYNGASFAPSSYSPGITLDSSPNGQIVIVDINPESSTWHSSLKIGDVVVRVDGSDVRTVSEANNLLRGDQESVIAIETDENEVSVVRDLPGPGGSVAPGPPMPPPPGMPGIPPERQYGDVFVQPGDVGSLMDQATCARFGLPMGTVWGPPTGRKTAPAGEFGMESEDVRGTQV